MNGVLIIDKPSGLTSHDVVNRVRRILGQRSVGHLGTLDPLATGVLPLVLGSFMAVSDSPLQLDAQRWLDTLLRYRIDAKPVFDMSLEKDRHRLDEVLSLTATMDRNLPSFFTLESAGHIRARTAQARIVTDDNMGTEWSQQGLE